MFGNKKHLLLFILPVFLSFLLACNTDFLGLVRSISLEERLEVRDKFVFLTEDDRTLSFGDEYSFIVLADTHIEEGRTYGLERLKDVIIPSDKFVVITGDITQSGLRQDIQKIIDIANTLDIPFYPVIGNHDFYFDNWQNWKELIGSTRYRIDGGSTTLFILDSGNSYLGKAQLDWLEREIKNTGEWVFVFSHHCLFVNSPVAMHKLADTRERARVLSILKTNANAMFMGHSHSHDHRNIEGVLYLALPDYRSTRKYYRVFVKACGITYQIEKL